MKKFKELQEAGMEVIACVSVNDVFVMDEWGKNYTPSAQEVGIRMLADPQGDMMREMGMEKIGTEKILGNVRSHRYAAVIENGKILKWQLDETGIEKTMPESILQLLAEA